MMSRRIPVIIFLGAPGAGKGTQASRLSQQRSIPKISTGDMLRSAVQQDSELGRRVKAIMNDGGLVDDDTMLDLVVDRISKPDCVDGFILDGYPRNLHQASQLEHVLKSDMQVCVFNIEISEEEIVKRIGGRRTCRQCERIYNIYNHPPKNDEKCDFDGTALFMRNDDQEEVVRKRITTYKKETFPLIEHYRNRSVLRVINGLQSEQQVAEEILKCLTSIVEARVSPPYEGGD